MNGRSGYCTQALAWAIGGPEPISYYVWGVKSVHDLNNWNDPDM